MSETNTLTPTRNRIAGELQKSVHGDLSSYKEIIDLACTQDPEFVSHLIAFDCTHGQIKDSKIALPVLTLASRSFPDELVENSLAHLALMPPRELLKALRFSFTCNASGRRQRALESMIRSYLAVKESNPGQWMRLAARHRRSLTELYVRTHAPAPAWVSAILFGWARGEDGNKQHRDLKTMLAEAVKSGDESLAQGLREQIRALKVALPRPANSIFADIANLHSMPESQVAATIQKWHLSPLIVTGALAGARKEVQTDSAVVQAGIEQMSDTEVVTRVRSLERSGLSRDPGLKSAFRGKLAKATKSSKATLKTGVAAEEVEDESIKVMLKELQERQIQAQKDSGRGLDGDWLVIVDRSLSQSVAIKLGVHISASIAKFVTGRVHMVFCNNEAVPMEVTGMRLEDIQEKVKFITAAGGTSYGIGLSWAREKKLNLDGVVVVGDGGENSQPLFVTEWHEWKRKFDRDLPVYFFQTFCPPEHARSQAGDPRLFEYSLKGAHPMVSARTGGVEVPVVKHDMSKGDVDYFSVPNLVQTISANRFGVVEKIMACPLVTLTTVIPGADMDRILPKPQVMAAK